MNKIPWEKLAQAAWEVRENSHIVGNTKVGASLYTENGKIISGCNIEHKFRSHDIHAEVNAIGNMVASGEKKFLAILIVAERDFFTPCGSCMDWIMQHGVENCFVAFENKIGERQIFRSTELMPHYPN